MAKKKSVKKKKPKKHSKTKVSKKKTTKKSKVSSQIVQVKMEPVLVDNFIALQKVMVNLASKLDGVTIKIEKLLDLFETSAKTLAKKDFKLAGESSPEVLKKLGELSEQNKIIAKGLTMIHEKTPAPAPMPTMPPIPTPMPTPAPSNTPMPARTPEEYKKSAPFKPLKSKSKASK